MPRRRGIRTRTNVALNSPWIVRDGKAAWRDGDRPRPRRSASFSSDPMIEIMIFAIVPAWRRHRSRTVLRTAEATRYGSFTRRTDLGSRGTTRRPPLSDARLCPPPWRPVPWGRWTFFRGDRAGSAPFLGLTPRDISRSPFASFVLRRGGAWIRCRRPSDTIFKIQYCKKNIHNNSTNASASASTPIVSTSETCPPQRHHSPLFGDFKKFIMRLVDLIARDRRRETANDLRYCRANESLVRYCFLQSMIIRHNPKLETEFRAEFQTRRRSLQIGSAISNLRLYHS